MCGARSGHYLDLDCSQIEQLARALSKLVFSILLVIDDVGYVRKDEAETPALLQLLMHRYERTDP